MDIVFKAADGREFSSALDCLEYESKPPVSLLSRITRMKRMILPGLHKSYMDALSAYGDIDSSFHHSEVSDLLHRLKVAREALKVGIAMYRSLRAQLKDFNSARHSNPLFARMYQEVQLALSHDKTLPDLTRCIYDSALGAYAAVLQGNHSGYSWDATHTVVNRMLSEFALTPVCDGDFVGIKDENPATTPRQNGLFRYLWQDDLVTYTDIKRAVGVYLDTGEPFTSGLVRAIVDEMFPIQMPYYTPGIPYRVHVRTYCDKGFPNDHHDFNRVWASHVVTPSGEYLPINRTWVQSGFGGLVEITDDKDELCHRRSSEE